MRMGYGFFYLLIFAVGCTSCRSAAAADEPYFPLVPGMYSPYIQWSNSADVFYNVVGSEEHYGQDVWAVLRGYDHTFTSRYFELYSIGADGDVLYHGRRSTTVGGALFEQVYEPPLRILDMPAVAGRSWTDTPTVYSYSDGVLIETEEFSYVGHIVGTESPVTVPAGDFTALEVTGIWDFGRSTRYWFSRGTGLVRTEVSDGLILALWAPVVAEDARSWGSLKALYR